MYSGSKYLAKRAISGKSLKYRACEIGINPKYDGYKGELTSEMYKFFVDKITSCANVNEVLTQELQKPFIKISEIGKYTPAWEIIFGQHIYWNEIITFF